MLASTDVARARIKSSDPDSDMNFKQYHTCFLTQISACSLLPSLPKIRQVLKHLQESPCEPAQSNCYDISQAPFYARIYWKNDAPRDRDNRFVRARTFDGRVRRAVLCENSIEFWEKMPRPKTGITVLCEPAQSKRTWTSHKSLFYARIYRGKSQTTD